MSPRVRRVHLSTIDIQVVAEERHTFNQEFSEEAIETLLTKRICLTYPGAYKFSSLIKEVIDKEIILYRLYAKVTVPIDRTTKEMFQMIPVPKTRFEKILEEME
jgi:hypothetical protein